MSWENNNVEIDPKILEKLLTTEKRDKRKKIGIPNEYLNSNIKTLVESVKSGKNGPLASLPPDMETVVLKSLGFPGNKNFKGTLKHIKNSMKKHEKKQQNQIKAWREAENKWIKNREGQRRAEENARRAEELEEERRYYENILDTPSNNRTKKRGGKTRKTRKQRRKTVFRRK